MARIRTIKPEFWTHPVMGRLSDLAKWVAVALLNIADDEGYFCADAAVIRGSIAPFTDDSLKIHGALTECSRAGWIELRNHPQRGQLGKIVNFTKHQRVNRPNPSTIKDYWSFSERSVSAHGVFSEHSHPEGKGKEGNGIGMEGECEGKPKPVADTSASSPSVTVSETEKPTTATKRARSILTADQLARFNRWYCGDGDGYNGYPRKVARGAAERAWRAINPDDALLATMIAAVQRQKRTWDDPKYIPHPATWLNQRRWEDETAETTPKSVIWNARG